MLIFIRWIVAFVWVFTTSFYAWGLPVRVRAGETLSFLAQDHKNGNQRIYGAKGFLSQILALNPQIQDPNSITPGMLIRLPVFHEDASTFSLDQKREVANTPKSEPKPGDQNKPDDETSQMIKASIDPLPQDNTESELRVDFQIDLVYSKIEARDLLSQAQASYISDLIPRYRLGTRTDLSSGWQLGAEFSVQKNSYLPPDEKTILQGAPDTKNMKVSLKKSFENGVDVTLSLGTLQDIFIRRETITAFTWDVATIPFVEINAGYEFLKWRNHQWGVSAEYAYLSGGASGVHRLQNGSSYAGRTWLRTDRKRFYLLQSLGAAVTQQNSNIVDQNKIELFLGIGLGTSF